VVDPDGSLAVTSALQGGSTESEEGNVETWVNPSFLKRSISQLAILAAIPCRLPLLVVLKVPEAVKSMTIIAKIKTSDIAVSMRVNPGFDN